MPTLNTDLTSARYKGSPAISPSFIASRKTIRSWKQRSGRSASLLEWSYGPLDFVCQEEVMSDPNLKFVSRGTQKSNWAGFEPERAVDRTAPQTGMPSPVDCFYRSG